MLLYKCRIKNNTTKFLITFFMIVVLKSVTYETEMP
jgi:hypothetical protein